MGYRVTENKGVSVRLNLENLRGYKKTFKGFLEEDGLENAARELQRRAYLAMAGTYRFHKKGYRDTHSKSEEEHVEHGLFGGDVDRFIGSISSPGGWAYGVMQPPIPSGGNSYNITILPNISTLISQYPYLLALETGRTSVVDQQPFLKSFTTSKLRGKYFTLTNITKRASYTVDPKLIQKVRVPHEARSARNFIKAAHNVLKNQGHQIVKEYIWSELKKRFNV